MSIVIREVFPKSVNDAQKYMREFYPHNLLMSVKQYNSHKSSFVCIKLFYLSDLVYRILNTYLHLAVIFRFLF